MCLQICDPDAGLYREQQTQTFKGGREARGGTKPATPVPPLILLEFLPAVWGRRAFRCAAAIWGSTHSIAYGGKTPDLQGFACIQLQSGGGNGKKAVPPPVFIENLQADGGLQQDPKRSGLRCLGARPCH